VGTWKGLKVGMDATTRLERTFKEVLALDDDVDIEALEYRGIEQWDSVAHMELVAAIEEQFDVLLETDDVLNLSSFGKAVKILEALGVDFSA
jgi:acyl carrier protein